MRNLDRITLAVAASVGITVAEAANAQKPEIWTYTKQVIQSPEHGGYAYRMLLSADGRLFELIFPPRGSVIQRYDPAGKYLGTIGRQGKGPGEYMSVNGVGLVGDTIWIDDAQLNRLNFFSTAGVSLGSAPSPVKRPSQPKSYENMTIKALIPGGAALLLDPESVNYPKYFLRTRERIVRIKRSALADPAPHIEDTLLAVKIRKESVTMPGKMSGGKEFVGATPQPWGDGDLYSAASLGCVHALVRREAAPVEGGKRPSYTITVFGVSGVLWTITVPFDPVKVTNAMVDEEFATLRRTQDTMTARWWQSEKAQRGVYMDSLYRPPYAPAVTAVRIGNDTTVWVRRAARLTDRTMTWDAYDAKGRNVATTILPRAFEPMAVSRDGFWGTEPGPEGDPESVRYVRKK